MLSAFLYNKQDFLCHKELYEKAEVGFPIPPLPAQGEIVKLNPCLPAKMAF